MVLVVLAVAWISGFVAAGALGAPWWTGAVGCATAGPAAVLVAAPCPRAVATCLVATILALAGGWRATGFLSRPPSPLTAFVGEEVTLVGRVDGESRRGLTTVRYPVKVSWVEDDGANRSLGGRVLITAGEYDGLSVGTLVRVSGGLERPPPLEGFDYAAYLARRGVAATMFRPQVEVLAEPSPWDLRAGLAAARVTLDRALGRSLPEPEAALASGILLGKDDALAEDVREGFRRTGLAHIVAVSGSNIIVITAMVFAGTSPFTGRRRAMVVAAFAVLCYVGLSGAAWTVVRAAIMASVYLLGEYLGRPRSSLDALSFAVIAITCARPGAAFEVGFQLSVAATAGLVAFGPWLRWAALRGLGGHGRAVVPGAIVDVMALSLSATLATLPISWAVFGQVSLVGPLANLIVEPLFPFAFASAAATAVAGATWSPAGYVAGFVAYYPVHAMVATAETLARLPLAAIAPGNVQSRFAIAAASLVGAAAWPCYRYLPPDAPHAARSVAASWLRAISGLGVAGASAAAFVAISLLPLRGPGALRLVVLDVGQGDALLVVTPRGRQVLVDGGPSGLRLVQELGRVLPHWDRSVDAVILTHPQEDHVAGLPGLLERYRAGQALGSGATNTSTAARLYLEASGGVATTVSRGTSFEIDGVRFDVLWPPAGDPAENLNDLSVVTRVSYRGQVMLLPGDLEGGALARLADITDVRADVLKVPHHGSRTTPAWFFDAADPALAVISVGEGNRFGHPAPATLEALSRFETLRTDIDGRVTITLDGERVRARAASGRAVSLPERRKAGYGGAQQEVVDGYPIRWQDPGSAPPGEADTPRSRVRRRQLPRRVRQDPCPVRRKHRGTPARMAPRHGERMDHVRIQHAPPRHEDADAA